MVFIDPFMDWGNPSIYRFVPVGSITSSLDLVTDVYFKLVLYNSRDFYKCI